MKTEETIKMSVLADLFNNKSKYFHSQQQGHQGLSGEREYQGEYNETFKFYKHPEFPKEYFMRETWKTDSYGDNETIAKVEFVKGVEKSITVFEPIV